MGIIEKKNAMTTKTITFVLAAAAGAVQLQAEYTQDHIQDMWVELMSTEEAQQWTEDTLKWMDGAYDDFIDWNDEYGLEPFYRDLFYACENENCDQVLLDFLFDMAFAHDAATP